MRKYFFLLLPLITLFTFCTKKEKETDINFNYISIHYENEYAFFSIYSSSYDLYSFWTKQNDTLGFATARDGYFIPIDNIKGDTLFFYLGNDKDRSNIKYFNMKKVDSINNIYKVASNYEFDYGGIEKRKKYLKRSELNKILVANNYKILDPENYGTESDSMLIYYKLKVKHRSLKNYNPFYFINSSNGLNLRSEPNLESNILRKLDHNQMIIVNDTIKSTSIDGIKGYWLEVSDLYEKGYIFSGYIERNLN